MMVFGQSVFISEHLLVNIISRYEVMKRWEDIRLIEYHLSSYDFYS